MKTTVQFYEKVRQASLAATGIIHEIAASAVADKGFCTIVLAGGRTPWQTYELLGKSPKTTGMPWPQCHFFWGDERWLPATHPDSNFYMADKTLLSRLQIPFRHIHRIPFGNRDPNMDAALYERHLRDFFHSTALSESDSVSENNGYPIFDLVLLGMGSDGHIASLFPGSDSLTEKERWVLAVSGDGGSPPVPRITLTLPVLNQARNILFLIGGKKKKQILDQFLDKSWPERKRTGYPAAYVKARDQLFWLVSDKG